MKGKNRNVLKKADDVPRTPGGKFKVPSQTLFKQYSSLQKPRLTSLYPFLTAEQINRKVSAMWTRMSADEKRDFNPNSICAKAVTPRRISRISVFCTPRLTSNKFTSNEKEKESALLKRTFDFELTPSPKGPSKLELLRSRLPGQKVGSIWSNNEHDQSNRRFLYSPQGISPDVQFRNKVHLNDKQRKRSKSEPTLPNTRNRKTSPESKKETGLKELSTNGSQFDFELVEKGLQVNDEDKLFPIRWGENTYSGRKFSFSKKYAAPEIIDNTPNNKPGILRRSQERVKAKQRVSFDTSELQSILTFRQESSQESSEGSKKEEFKKDGSGLQAASSDTSSRLVGAQNEMMRRAAFYANLVGNEDEGSDSTVEKEENGGSTHEGTVKSTGRGCKRRKGSGGYDMTKRVLRSSLVERVSGNEPIFRNGRKSRNRSPKGSRQLEGDGDVMEISNENAAKNGGLLVDNTCETMPCSPVEKADICSAKNYSNIDGKDDERVDICGTRVSRSSDSGLIRKGQSRQECRENMQRCEEIMAVSKDKTAEILDVPKQDGIIMVPMGDIEQVVDGIIERNMQISEKDELERSEDDAINSPVVVGDIFTSKGKSQQDTEVEKCSGETPGGISTESLNCYESGVQVVFADGVNGDVEKPKDISVTAVTIDVKAGMSNENKSDDASGINLEEISEGQKTTLETVDTDHENDEREEEQSKILDGTGKGVRHRRAKGSECIMEFEIKKAEKPSKVGRTRSGRNFCSAIGRIFRQNKMHHGKSNVTTRTVTQSTPVPNDEYCSSTQMVTIAEIHTNACGYTEENSDSECNDQFGSVMREKGSGKDTDYKELLEQTLDSSCIKGLPAGDIEVCQPSHWQPAEREEQTLIDNGGGDADRIMIHKTRKEYNKGNATQSRVKELYDSTLYKELSGSTVANSFGEAVTLSTKNSSKRAGIERSLANTTVRLNDNEEPSPKETRLLYNARSLSEMSTEKLKASQGRTPIYLAPKPPEEDTPCKSKGSESDLKTPITDTSIPIEDVELITPMMAAELIEQLQLKVLMAPKKGKDHQKDEAVYMPSADKELPFQMADENENILNSGTENVSAIRKLWQSPDPHGFMERKEETTITIVADGIAASSVLRQDERPSLSQESNPSSISVHSEALDSMYLDPSNIFESSSPDLVTQNKTTDFHVAQAVRRMQIIGNISPVSFVSSISSISSQVLSGISQLSSESSKADEVNGRAPFDGIANVDEETETRSDSEIHEDDETNIQEGLTMADTDISEVDCERGSETFFTADAKRMSVDGNGGDLCNMFEEMTPPEAKNKGGRRLIASNHTEGGGSFGGLFEDDDIFF